MQMLLEFLNINIWLYHPPATLRTLSHYIRYHEEKALIQKTVEYSAFHQETKHHTTKSCRLHVNLQHPPQQTNPGCAFRQCSWTKIFSKDPMKAKHCSSPRQGALPCAEHCPNTTGTGRLLKSSLTVPPQAAAPLPRLAHTWIWTDCIHSWIIFINPSTHVCFGVFNPVLIVV